MRRDATRAIGGECLVASSLMQGPSNAECSCPIALRREIAKLQTDAKTLESSFAGIVTEAIRNG